MAMRRDLETAPATLLPLGAVERQPPPQGFQGDGKAEPVLRVAGVNSVMRCLAPGHGAAIAAVRDPSGEGPSGAGSPIGDCAILAHGVTVAHYHDQPE